MVKHTQTIRWQQPTNCLSVFDHFKWLVLKGLNLADQTQLFLRLLINQRYLKNRITLIPYRFLYFSCHLVVKDVFSNTFQKSLQHTLKKGPLENLQYALWVLPMRQINYCKPRHTRCHPNQSGKKIERLWSCVFFAKLLWNILVEITAYWKLITYQLAVKQSEFRKQ